ncbi:hypothetical protein [Tsukamurella tyrosinosolvens]|uniref:Uncharacterized protein n=1 Tax=Tsukamurella tyrosinosolvens TaxID=57704 RepID=A0A1H4UNQ1_TSUTY|nr:hypothetical protein [Tsukamurella tyrosinosolvens]SEC70335.1 hypothetical protein SAMN04489793_2963 [Tsukamurella tyrosinosolvens]
MHRNTDRLIWLIPVLMLLIALDGWFLHWTASSAVLHFGMSMLGLG